MYTIIFQLIQEMVLINAAHKFNETRLNYGRSGRLPTFIYNFKSIILSYFLLLKVNTHNRVLFCMMVLNF